MTKIEREIDIVKRLVAQGREVKGERERKEMKARIDAAVAKFEPPRKTDRESRYSLYERERTILIGKNSNLEHFREKVWM
jgi:hypothetical protein